MNRARKMVEGPLALDLIEETFHCLRRAPARVWLIYYAGTLPFVLALLYFWADMSRGAFAHERLASAALLMTVLFIVMKSCHCRFAAHLTAGLCGRATASWGVSDWLGIALRQSVWQPLGLFLLPAALALLAPFGWVYAFFQNVSVLDGSTSSNRSLFQRAWRQTMLWPGQNHAALFALKGFAFFVFVNLIIAALAVPHLLRILVGVETSFSRVMGGLTGLILIIFNTTFLSVIAGLTYLCVDPFFKTFYVLRCFYGESLRTGQDLQAELSRWRSSPALATAALILLMALAPPSARAAEPSSATPASAQIEAGKLDQAIDEVLSARQYRWRLPRTTVQTETEKGFIGMVIEEISNLFKDVFKSLGVWVKKALNWITQSRMGGGGGLSDGWHTALRGVLVALGAILTFLVVLLLVRTWRQNVRTSEVHAEPVLDAPDLDDESVAADELPEDSWLQLARELIASGDLRLALRAFYLASLAHLAGRHFLTIAKFKSNFDYLRELERRGHVVPELIRLFGENVTVFDRVWYGLHQVDLALLDHFSHNVDQIRRAA